MTILYKPLAFVLFSFSLTVYAFGQAKPDPWLILTCGKQGFINAHTTREDLVRAFGAGNVIDQDVAQGEDTFPGTVVFPKDPNSRIEILWNDSDAKVAPSSVTIWGTVSQWHTIHGISLGTALTELNRLNGRSFRLTGFGTDEPGGISWEQGSLEQELQSCGRVILTLDYTPHRKMTGMEVSRLNRDSHNPLLQRFNFRVNRITWEFPVTR